MLLELIDASAAVHTVRYTAERSAKLMGVMDELNRRIGRGTIKLGIPSTGATYHLIPDT